MDDELDQKLREYQNEYLQFLDDEEDQGIYHKKVKQMIENNRIRLTVNVNDLRKKNPQRANNLLNNTFEEQLAFQRALKDYIGSVDPDYASSNEEFFFAFEGSFGNKHVTPRTLVSRYLGNLVCVEGIVTKCSLIRPKIVRSVHYCPATKKIMERRYTDLTSLEAYPSSAVYPTKDDDGNMLETEYGLSSYKDHQTISIQEMPEKAPAGQLPRSVDIVVDNDLVDLCKPGDRVQIVGNYRCLPGKQGSFTTGAFRTVLIANNVSQMSKDASIFVTRDDLKKCRALSRQPNIFERLSRSLAPSIQGHEYIKKAILCLLLGGVEKVLPNGTRLRGDINVLLIGDPSVAKSQLLRYVLCTAVRAVTTTGRGSSGVGLTAAVTTDQETGERRLEAGAMVLADRGVVCIDEFDKMSDLDRTAIHEVMEQGRVTIAKAGIQARLNARCSVLAAANPVYGKYDQYKAPMENIGLQDSLLSRFDLLFVMLDLVDKDNDKIISDHVVRMHRFRNPREQDGEVLPMGSDVDVLSTLHADKTAEELETRIFEKYDPLLHGASRKKTDRIFSMQFMRKYINIAKVLKPVLTEEASEVISEEYSRLRSLDLLETDVARTQPVTVRTLETLIRLSTAHAKARLSRTVEKEDADVAIQLIQFAYFKRVLEKEKRKRRRADDSDEEEDGNEEEMQEDEDEEAEESSQRAKRSRTSRSQEAEASTAEQGDEVFEIDSGSAAADTPGLVRVRASEEAEEPFKVLAQPTDISTERYNSFKSSICNLFRSERSETLRYQRAMTLMNEQQQHQQRPFTEGEAAAAVQQMSDANQVMYADGMLFLI
ncbi:zygotic DNA replication licensing factor mcm3 [Nilaparvata lugens]|uniref:zygotic DNA replication licensing factor mcm3 n=1 Tax=Nilaparvata lugens TaxID=108931 RepID=UPI00193E3A06|nr:zygotic DNA replication licensing factor mcm3 [Nilaparvata lugens]